MINTNFSIQTNSTGFIDADNVARRKELERILRFDFINDLIKMASDQYKKNKNIYDYLQKTMPPERIKETMDIIKGKEEKLKALDDVKVELSKKYEDVQKKLDELNKNIIPNVDERIEKIRKKINKKKEDLNKDKDEAIKNKQKELEVKNKLVSKGKELKKLKDQYNNLINIDSINRSKDSNIDSNIDSNNKYSEYKINFDTIKKLDKDSKKLIKDNLQSIQDLYNDSKVKLKNDIDKIQLNIDNLQGQKKGYKLINDLIDSSYNSNSNDINEIVIKKYINKTEDKISVYKNDLSQIILIESKIVVL